MLLGITAFSFLVFRALLLPLTLRMIKSLKIRYQAMDNQPPRRHFAGTFLLNMLPTFLGVLLAFWLSEWASARNFKAQERHLLMEVQHELELNLSDLEQNLAGHEKGLAAAKSIQRLLSDGSLSLDTLPMHYVEALRDFISIQHTAAYETLKSRGLASIANDSLRLQIADLYDFDFETIEKVEEKYSPHEFFEHYNEPFLRIVAKCYDFTPGEVADRRIMPLSALPKEEKNMMNARLNKIKYDRQFSIRVYQDVVEKVEKAIAAIKKELGDR